jgi:dTDP-4-dehydrorhamnose 3,5-epimerase
MTVKWDETTIPGVVRRTLPVYPDDRGEFRELWRASWTDGISGRFIQANLSRSKAGVLRGMHAHQRQDDLWLVLEGRAFVALVDLRQGPSQQPRHYTFDASAGQAVLIPAGVAHGFLAIERLALGYLVTTEYNGTDEHGFAWDDPLAAIPWPRTDPVLSARDQVNPRLASVLETWPGVAGGVAAAPAAGAPADADTNAGVPAAVSTE